MTRGDGVAVDPDCEAAQILSERRIGTLIISRDDKPPDGILSERDIVRELGRAGAACLTNR